MLARTVAFIRDADIRDIKDITQIYRHAVLHGTASFELSAPDETEMARRFQILADDGFPHLVAVIDDLVAGYAYASAYRPRPAYRYTVEDSVYVAPNFQGMGVGNALLEALIERCAELGYRQMVAVIGDEASAGSIALHRSKGFEHVGVLRDVGFKHGDWRGTILMQRALGDGNLSAPADAV